VADLLFAGLPLNGRDKESLCHPMADPHPDGHAHHLPYLHYGYPASLFPEGFLTGFTG